MSIELSGGSPSSIRSSSPPPDVASAQFIDEIKNVKFSLGRGNKTDAKLIVVHKREFTDPVGLTNSSGTLRIKDKTSAPNLIKNVLLSEEFLGKIPPKVLISVTGAATNFGLDPNLEQIFCKGLVNAAKSTTAWIVSGGTDVGVMHFVGEANRRFETDVTTIGFATYSKINNGHLLKSVEKTVEYDAAATPAKDSVNLNANHSHFVLIESDKDIWGEEIEARSDFEEYMCTEYQLPLCLIVVNGGPGTLRTVAEGTNRKFSVVIFEGTGRAADMIAREIRKKRKQPFEHLAPMDLNAEGRTWMDQIVEGEECVTLYTSATGPFDFEILKSILKSKHGSLLSKLSLAVEWNRVDLAEHLLEENEVAPDELATVLSKALELSLDLEKPDLFRLFSEKGARKTDIDLGVLYTVPTQDGTVIDPLISRYYPHISLSGTKYNKTFTHLSGPSKKSHSKVSTVQVGSDTPLLTRNQKAHTDPILTEGDVYFIKSIFKSVDGLFDVYASTLAGKLLPGGDGKHKKKGKKQQSEYGAINDGSVAVLKEGSERGERRSRRSRVTYTDAMLWAILMGKLELAKVVWEKTTLPVHTALVASGLCKGVGKWLLNERESFMETAQWFEDVAIKLIEKMEYDSVKMLLEFNWAEFGHNPLEIAVGTESKDFTSNPHVQRLLDEMLYNDKHGGTPPGTGFYVVIPCIFFPFLARPLKAYNNRINSSGQAMGSWYHFYGLPSTKFWTSTLCYIGYLMLLAVVMAQNKFDFKISPAEYVLWVWMLGYAIEELSQLQEEGSSYFQYNSNRMDMFILLLQVVYVALAIAAVVTKSNPVLEASTDFLIVATVISYVRLMDVFSISKDLGPLYVVLQNILWDVWRWIFVFLTFAIGFQISFMALNQQAQREITDSSASGVPDQWTPTINGGSFMGAFFTIIGDWDSTMQNLKWTTFGAIITSIYALIAQIMLVNLLIAMMGDTFNSVKENSDKQWKYSRYSLIAEYTSTSFHPPPTNIVVLPIKHLIRKISRAPPPPEFEGVKLTPKQREQFKNLLKNVKESYLEDRANSELKTIDSVSDHVRENFKAIIERSELKHSIIESKLTEITNGIKKLLAGAAFTAAISGSGPGPAAPGSGGGSGPSSGPAPGPGPAPGGSALPIVQEITDHVAGSVKNEIQAFQKAILDAVKGTPSTDFTTVRLQNNDVRVTWERSVPGETVNKVINEYKPFKEWVANMNKPQNNITVVRSIHIQNIDMFGPRIGFVKFHANVMHSSGRVVPGIVFMRGASVAILVILKLDAPGSPDHGKEYTIVTIQPRIPVGEAGFCEIPAGMLDGGQFAGIASKELKEETGIEIKEEDLIDLTQGAYEGTYSGMYPSAGGCDEFLRLFVYRAWMSREELEAYHNKLTGALDENEVICLKVLPLENLWREAPDAKALSALYLYSILKANGVIPEEFAKKIVETE